MFMLNFKKEYRRPALNPLQISPLAEEGDSEPEAVAVEQESAALAAAALNIPASAPVVAVEQPVSDMAAARPARLPDASRLQSRSETVFSRLQH